MLRSTYNISVPMFAFTYYNFLCVFPLTQTHTLSHALPDTNFVVSFSYKQTDTRLRDVKARKKRSTR